MGLNEGGGAKTYLKISDGKIALKCDENTPGAIACQNKEGTRKWFEKRFPSVSGKIMNALTRDTDYGKVLCIEILDGSDRFELQMHLDSKYAGGFLKCMPNIDLNRVVYFKPWMKEVTQDGKPIKKTALYLTYDLKGEEKIEWFWTRENSLGMPDLTQVTVKGKQVWDNTDQMNFLVEYLTGTFQKKISAAVMNIPAGADLGHEIAQDFQPEPTPEDDLPF